MAKKKRVMALVGPVEIVDWRKVELALRFSPSIIPIFATFSSEIPQDHIACEVVEEALPATVNNWSASVGREVVLGIYTKYRDGTTELLNE